MKILFAVSNESISEAIIKKYQQMYKEIISSKNVYYFNAITKELQKDKSYDRIVISEDLEPFASKNYDTIDNFLFEKLDNISDEASNTQGEDIPIILISTDRRTKGENLLVKLFGIGVYSALIGQDRSIEQVCNLINKPRSKKEAKVYYKISSNEVEYKSESEGDVSEIEIQNILAHYKRLGKNEEKYVDSFNSIANQYTDEQLRLIVKFLPLNVKAVLEANCPKYQQIVAFSGNTGGQVEYRNPQSKFSKKQEKQQKTDKQAEKAGLKIESIKSEKNNTILSKPVIIPSEVTTNNIRKVEQKIDNIEQKKKGQPVNVQQMQQPQMARPTPISQEQPEMVRKEQVMQEPLKSVEMQNQQRENVSMQKPTMQTSTVQEPPKKGRGRPKKIQPNENPVQNMNEQVQNFVPNVAQNIEEPVKKRRGRPRKVQTPVSQESENNLPGFNNYEEQNNNMLPGFDNYEEQSNNTLPGFDNYEQDNNLNTNNNLDGMLPGFDNYEEQNNDILPGFNDYEQNGNLNANSNSNGMLPGFDDYEEQNNDILPGFNDYEQNNNLNANSNSEEMLPGFNDYEEQGNDTLPGFNDYNQNNNSNGMSQNFNNYEEQNSETLPEFNNYNPNNQQNSYNNQNYVENNNQQQVTLQNNVRNEVSETLLSGDKKIVGFVGTSKNGTSFIVDNLAQMLSSQGIKTAILDLTQNKNAYYIYTKNEEDLRKIATNCMKNLEQGTANGITVNPNLDVYTSLPGEEEELNVNNVIATLSQRYSLILVDCDFKSDYRYIAQLQELYLIQSMDVLTIQPLTAYLRDLKAKGILDQNKLRIVINKYIRVRSLTEKTIIGGMAFYNDPAMSFMTELFNRETIKYTIIPFDVQAYSKYLEGLVNCEISLNGYSKEIIAELRKLANMVYPLVTNGQKYGKEYNKKQKMQYGQYQKNFSNEMNDTLNKMKNNY